MREIIVESLERVEREKEVRVLLAVESGSRAWGFASSNSDWDVRFVYARGSNHYLSIDVENKRDVIECGIDERDIDMVGWDIRKALKLFAKSNPSIIEWLQSPDIYWESAKLQGLRDMIPSVYSPVAGYWHYMSMARSNKRNYLSRDVVPLKKYLHVMRGLLSARWVGTYLTPPPLNFSLLLPLVDDREVLGELGRILVRKTSGDELMEGERVPVLDRFIEEELGSDNYLPKVDRADVDYDQLNRYFREAVK